MAKDDEKNGGSGGGAKKRARRDSETPSLSAAVSDARQSVGTMLEDWRDMVDEHPIKALGLALAAGYVVGGGLLTTFTGRLLLGGARIGIRLAALPMVRDELMGLVSNMGERGRSEQERRQQ